MSGALQPPVHAQRFFRVYDTAQLSPGMLLHPFTQFVALVFARSSPPCVLCISFTFSLSQMLLFFSFFFFFFSFFSFLVFLLLPLFLFSVALISSFYLFFSTFPHHSLTFFSLAPHFLIPFSPPFILLL